MKQARAISALRSTSLAQSAVFSGFDPDELVAVLSALSASRRRYAKGERILSAGTATRRMGFVEDGRVVIERVELDGQRTVLGSVDAGDFFAEVYAIVPDEPMMVDVSANGEASVIWLDIGFLGRMGLRSEPWVVKFQNNLLRVAARKNLALSRRAFVTAPKSTRARIAAFLQIEERRANVRPGEEFDIPFDRQQLSDYLNLDRSALSRELGRMRNEGLVMFRKKRFALPRQRNGRLK